MKTWRKCLIGFALLMMVISYCEASDKGVWKQESKGVYTYSGDDGGPGSSSVKKLSARTRPFVLAVAITALQQKTGSDGKGLILTDADGVRCIVVIDGDHEYGVGVYASKLINGDKGTWAVPPGDLKLKKNIPYKLMLAVNFNKVTTMLSLPGGKVIPLKTSIGLRFPVNVSLFCERSAGRFDFTRPKKAYEPVGFRIVK